MHPETRKTLPVAWSLCVLIGVPCLVPIFSGCALFTKPQAITVVAPSGPATNSESSAITDHLAKTDAALSAFTSSMSKVSASAGSIRTINSGQPTGPRTTGVDGEGALIQAVAGQPSQSDAVEAATRSAIVAQGNASDIAKAYANAQTAALQAQKQLGDTQVALTASNAALVKAKAEAAAEQASLSASLQARIDKIQADANAKVTAAQAKAESDSRKLITWIFFGGGALLFAAGLAILFFASSVPMFGPKAGMAVMASGGGLIFIGMVMNELAKHPWILWAGISLCIASAAIAVGLIVSNNGHAVEAAKAEALKLETEVKATL